MDFVARIYCGQMHCLTELLNSAFAARHFLHVASFLDYVIMLTRVWFIMQKLENKLFKRYL